MKIYRFETDDGRGPYKYDLQLIWNGNFNCDPSKCPTPERDERLAPEWNSVRHLSLHYKFGFISEDQVMSWFPTNTRRLLIEAGIKLRIYHVDESDVIQGDTQCVFKHRWAVLVEELHPVTLESLCQFDKKSA